MNINERDIEKGSLHEILPKFHPDSISYLSELNDYRMYAEVWSNNRSDSNAKRKEIGHAGYLKTLEFGEQNKKRKSDKVRFDNFVVADSVNYKVAVDLYRERKAYIQIWGVQTNTVFNNIINPGIDSGTQPPPPGRDFHAGGYVPKIQELELNKMGLHQDMKANKQYFEISTNSNDISNQLQKMLLEQIFGGHDIIEKLHLLYKVGRKNIRCLFENSGNITKKIGASDAIPRLCVARPFLDTLVFDFAGTPEEYGEACLLGMLINSKRGQAESMGHFDKPQIDSFA